jgi:hypothetical protein
MPAEPEPHTEAEEAAAERLGMPVAELRTIIDVYLEECRRLSLERRDRWHSSPVYQAWLNKKEKPNGGNGTKHDA